MQLLNWWKRRSNPAAGVRAFEIAPHSSDAKFPQNLVAKALRGEKAVSLFDAKRVLLFQTPSGTFIWQVPHPLACELACCQASGGGVLQADTNVWFRVRRERRSI